MIKKILKLTALVLSFTLITTAVPADTYAAEPASEETGLEWYVNDPPIEDERQYDDSEITNEPAGSDASDIEAVNPDTEDIKPDGYLGVELRSERDIKDFIASHPASVSDQVTYSEKPKTSYPYALGRISDKTRTSALNMLNTIRYIAGLYSDVTSDDRYETLAQAACVVDAANGQLSHYPSRVSDMDQEMYELGAEGARSSNLGWGYGTLNQVILNGWTGDSDSSNIDRLGHRRWVLNPAMTKTGFGYAASYSAMYAFDNEGYVPEGTMVAWPAQNMPVEYFGSSDAWSLSTGTYQNISEVKVTLTRSSDNKTWKFDSSSSNGYFNVENSGYGQPGCVIFRPNGIGSYKEGDKYNVTVTGLNSGTVSYDVSFFKAVRNATGLTLDKTRLDLNVGDTGQITATVVPEDATNNIVEWSSSNESVATVDQTGLVTAIDTGTTTIMAKITGSAIQKTCKVNVDRYYSYPISAVKTLTAGEQLDIIKECFGEIEGIAKYRVVLTDTEESGPAYASVSNKGILSAKKPGKVTVIPQVKGVSSYIDIKDASLTVTILPKPVLKFAAPLTYEGQKINAYDHFADKWSESGYEVKRFTSSKTDIVKVDPKTGEITAGEKEGTAVITAYLCEKGIDNAANTVKVTGSISYKKPSFTKDMITVQTGQTLIIGMKNVNGQSDPEFISSDTDRMTVKAQLNNKGAKTGKAELKALKAGTEEIVLTAVIDGIEYKCRVLVTAPVIQKAKLKVKAGKTVTVGLKNTKLKKTDIVWVSEDPETADVSEGGVVTGKKEGKVIIYTEAGGVRNQCEVTVY